MVTCANARDVISVTFSRITDWIEAPSIFHADYTRDDNTSLCKGRVQLLRRTNTNDYAPNILLPGCNPLHSPLIVWGTSEPDGLLIICMPICFECGFQCLTVSIEHPW